MSRHETRLRDLAALEQDGYVLVPKDAIPSKKPVQIFEHDEKAKTVLLDEQTYRDLNRCACLLHKAAQEG